MTSVWDGLATKAEIGDGSRSRRRAMGAGDRRKWSALARQDTVDAVVAQLSDNNFYGAAIMGPRGVGKTTLARSVEHKLANKAHFIRLFGNDTETLVPYGVFRVLMARLTERQSESAVSILEALAEVVKADGRGRLVVIVLDDLPSVDTSSMGVIMHLLLSGTAKLMVMARHPGDLPEDIVWMIKDRLLSETRIEAFSREETRALLVKALGGTVVESVVSSLFNSSAGNPLVLHALVNEYLVQDVLNNRAGVWVLDDVSAVSRDSVLSEVVSSRLARESAVVNQGVRKMAVLKRLPLSVAITVLGEETLWELEERGLIKIARGGRRTVSLAENYIAESVSGWLSTAEKASLFHEISEIVSLDPSDMTDQELLLFAAWSNDAGMVLDPKVAVAAARAAVQLGDPKLGLDCCAHVPAGHELEVEAAQARSRAYYFMANYPRSVAVLEVVDPQVLAGRCAEEQAAWASDLVNSLLWVPGGYFRIEQVLAELELRLQEFPADHQETVLARKHLNLARFSFLVHKGDFAQVAQELEAESKGPGDLAYQLNCACLLTMVMAATGREVESMELSASIDAQVNEFDVVLRFSDWHLQARVLALTWSGQWRACEALLKGVVEQYLRVTPYGGGVLELALGVAYTYAGLGTQAASVLLTAAAQLEVRDTWHSLGLVYSALAFAFAQSDDEENARLYLRKAQNAAPYTLWTHRSVAKFFQRMAQRWMGDDSIPARMVSTALADASDGKFTPASIGFFGATLTGTDQEFIWLEESSLKRQGAMAGINVALAQAHRTGNPLVALEAAAEAEALELPAVEFRSAAVALDLAHIIGDSKAAMSAQKRLDRLRHTLSVLPISPTVPAVKLTSRELQIARLARLGQGNRAIATRIGVSVRTVEGHLYQVFAKLGISSRDELELFSEL